MVTSVNTVHANCRPEKAFDYVADLTTHPLWSPDNIRVEALTDPPVKVGSRFRTTGYSVVSNADNHDEIEVTAFERPSRFAFVAHSHGRDFENSFAFTEASGGTLIERTVKFEPVPQMAERMKTAGPMLAERRDQSLAMLKGLLEK